MLITAGSEHRRHRKVAEPSFTAGNSSLVWTATDNLMQEIFASHDEDFPKQDVPIPDAISFTRRIALVVIKIAGFGVASPWVDKNDKPKAGQSISLCHVIAKVIELQGGK